MTNKLPNRTIALNSRKKAGLFLWIIISFVFAIFFFHVITNLDWIHGKIISMILFLVSVGVLIFNIVATIILKREGYIGFLISGDGFNDISTGNNYGMVYWRDIVKIRIVKDLEHRGRKYIVLKVKDPQQYMDREPLVIKKRSLMLKYHYYGSPICFSNRGLNCTFEQLESWIRMYYDNYMQEEEEERRDLTGKQSEQRLPRPPIK